MPRNLRLAGWLGLAILVLGGISQAQAQPSLWNGYQGGSDVSLSYVPNSIISNPGTLHLLAVELSTGNPSQTISVGSTASTSTNNMWTVDTGSTGAVISADYLKTAYGIDASTLPQNNPGHITYSSSQLTYTGFYATLNVGLYSTAANGTGTLGATAQLPVLIATTFTDSSGNVTTYCPKPTTCQAPNSISLEQFGIGFGRGMAPNIGSTYRNPLLNLTQVSTGNLQTMAPGYVVSLTGIQLGLTPAQLQNTAFSGLLPTSTTTPTMLTNAYAVAATKSDWQTPALTMTIKNASPSSNGTSYGSILVDTGITNIELSTGAYTYWNPVYDSSNPAKSTSIQVYVPGATSATGQPLTYQLLYQGVCPGAIGSCPPYNATNYGLSPVYPLNSKDAQNYGFAFVGSTADQPIPYPFINTGAEFLNYFNIIYDPVSGFFGYQESPTAVPNATNFPALNESIAIQGMTTIPGGTVVSMPTLLFAEFIDGYSGTAGPQTVVQLSSPGQVTMSGVISSAIVCGSDTCVGTGLEIAGGTFVLTANNAYLGGTTIDPGATLALAGAGSIAASAGVAANGNFDISGTAAGAQIAALSGTGTVNLGGQTLTLANASGVYGGTIADGGMAGGAGGSLVIAGGVQVLTGVNTYTGSTTITGGAMLAVNADAALGAATAPLIFNDGTLLALGDIVGTRPIVVESGGGVVDANGFTVSFGGPLTVNGPFVTMGTVVLGGNTTIGSDFTVSNGLLSVNGALQAPSLTVSPGATLRGTGTIGAPTTVAGTLAAGNSPGTLHFTAPVTLLPGAVSQFDIDGPGTGTGAGNYSRVLVSGAGNSFTAAGTLAPLLRGITGSATNSYTPPLGQVFQVVAAQGGVQGVYAGLTQPAGLGAGTRMDVLYGPTTIALAVTPQAYGALAQAGLMETANQSAVGSALDAMRPAAGAPMTPAQQALYAPLYPLPGAAIAPTLDALSPAIDADAMMVWRGAWYAMSDAVGAALETRRGGQPDAQQQVADGPRGSTLWVTALGQFGSVGSADGVPGYSGSSGGVAAGIDLPVLPNLTAGAALGFVSPQVSSTNGQDVWGQALQMTVYASLHQGIWFADAQAGGLFFQDNTTRPLPAYGAQAQGQTGGAGGGGSLRAGARLDAAAWRIQPSAGLTGLGLSRRGFTETQAGAADLSLGSAGLASVQSVLAVRAERRLALGATPFGEGLALVPTARLGWAHEFADTRGTVSAAFAGGPGASFGAHSAAVGRDAALIGLGATLLTAGPVSFDLAYSGAFAQNTNAQTLTGTVSVKW